MKKIIILLSTIFLVISCKSSYEYGCYYFTILSDGTVRFDGVHEKLRETISGTFYLPKKIYGRKVTQIGDTAFKDCKKITDISILNTITEIGNCAFEDCTSLKKIFIPKNVKKIASDAFYGCRSLQTIDFEDIAAWRGYRFYMGDGRYITIDASKPEPPSDADEENSNMQDTTYRVNGVSFTMKPIAAVKDAVLGDDNWKDLNGWYTNKEHCVNLSAYYIGETEVTQELWQSVMGANPSWFKDSGKNPVETVSWYDCVKFCNELTAKVMGENHCVYKINGDNVTADFSKKGFRLPTEAEWEYAAMGGKKHKYAGCNSENELKGYAWYKDNSDNKTHEVKTKEPNGYGLYDMSGNIWEWCWDWWSATTPSGGNDPHGADSGVYRIWRGGSFAFNVSYCERAYRGYIDPDNSGVNLGLRLVCRP